MSPFKSGQLSSEIFENTAFGLKNNGDVSEPFKSAYGWHIVKRLGHKPVEDFKDVKASLEARVKRDSRSKLINTAMVNELKSRYDISYNPEAKAYFESLINADFFGRSWRLPEDLEKDKALYSINNRTFTYGEFGRHLMSAQRIHSGKNKPASAVIDKEFNDYFEKSILQYREDNLELENKDFAHILAEYRDGLLLFDLMEKEVWNKASKDTTGLEAYYNTHKSNYQWEDRVEVVIASSAEQSNMKRVLKMMKKGKSQEDIEKALNTEDKQNVIYTKGTFNVKDSKLPSNFVVKEGLSKIYEHNEAFHVIDVKSILPAGNKTLKEAKGSVINDYQTEIESNWINDLHARFKVEVNNETLKAIKTKIGN